MTVAVDLPCRPTRRGLRVFVETVLTLAGMALVVGAAAADQQWMDRHFLPVFFLPRHLHMIGEAAARLIVAAMGFAIALALRPRLGRAVEDLPARVLMGDVLRFAVALILALSVGEAVLHVTFRATKDAGRPGEEPARQPDPRLGWRAVPSHVGYGIVGGRTVEYAFDAAGDRVRDSAHPVDPEQPTILFAGESIMMGYGLPWAETIPAEVERLTGVQSANLAMSAYSNDQAYMRFAEALPRFARPKLVVSLFMPSLFDRDFDDDRPHLGPGLTWLPARHRWRIGALIDWLVPYRSTVALDREIVITRAVLTATADLAGARGARALVVVPQFGEELPMERALRHRILDEAGISYITVSIDPTWRLPENSHPDSRATRMIAATIADFLERKPDKRSADLRTGD